MFFRQSHSLTEIVCRTNNRVMAVLLKLVYKYIKGVKRGLNIGLGELDLMVDFSV